MIKNTFYLTLSLFFKYLKMFCHVEKQHNKKARVNFKIYDVMHWKKKIITIHILLDISRGKSNQTMKFGQLNRM